MNLNVGLLDIINMYCTYVQYVCTHAFTNVVTSKIADTSLRNLFMILHDDLIIIIVDKTCLSIV